MSWSCSGRNNRELVRRLAEEKLVVTPRIVDAFYRVDRGAYCLHRESAYEDAPQSIGHGATISAPHMHAMAAEILQEHLQPGAIVLDVGSGSGYLTAIFGELVKPNGHAYGIDHIPELVEASIKSANASNHDLIETGVIHFDVADGRKGYPDKGPYDAIHVGAACHGKPTVLLEQLKIGGRLVAPVEHTSGFQNFMSMTRVSETQYKESIMAGVRYVPLTDRDAQERHSFI